MRIAYLDCFAGIAGDMFLGALIDAGVPASVLEDATTALRLGASLRVEVVDRSGIASTKVHVLEKGEPAERSGDAHASHPQEQQQASVAFRQHPQTQHQHKTGHAHSHTQEQEHAHDHSHSHSQDEQHEPTHAHGRSLTQIRTLIGAAALAEPVKHLALRAFELLGTAEARIHNVPVDEIHFHEVGAVDAIVDIVAASAGIHHLRIDTWYASAINVGGGMVECAHGTFPVPAPATADLLKGLPTYSAHVQKELVTPTGAALLRALNPIFRPQPSMRVEAIGYGAGTRNPEGFPNVLRLSVGEDASTGVAAEGAPTVSETDARRVGDDGDSRTELVTVLEAALDDASPQLLAYVAEQALAQGALDVMLSPVVMKKGRPGTLLTLLCQPENSSTFEQLLLRETPTLGLRIRQDRRICLERRHETVKTAYGVLRVKVGSAHGEDRNIAPEFEDCRAAAVTHGVPLKTVQQAVLAEYRHQRTR